MRLRRFVPTLVDIVERELVARHIKKAEFYAATKISSATFSQWRNNIYFPSAANIKTIEEYLGISISYSVADKDAKKERPTDGEALISELPEDIQKLIRICESNPDLAAALLSVAQQIEIVIINSSTVVILSALRSLSYDKTSVLSRISIALIFNWFNII